MLRIAFDAKEGKVGCVLLQATRGGTVPSFSAIFDVEDWLIAPTPDLKLYEITEEQVSKLARTRVVGRSRQRVKECAHTTPTQVGTKGKPACLVNAKWLAIVSSSTFRPSLQQALRSRRERL